MSNAVATDGDPTPLGDALVPFARVLANVDLQRATETDLTEVDAALDRFVAAIEGALGVLENVVSRIVSEQRRNAVLSNNDIEGRLAERV